MVGRNAIQFRGGDGNTRNTDIRTDKKMIDPSKGMDRQPGIVRFVRLQQQLSITKLASHAFVNHGARVRIKITA